MSRSLCTPLGKLAARSFSGSVQRHISSVVKSAQCNSLAITQTKPSTSKGRRILSTSSEMHFSWGHTVFFPRQLLHALAIRPSDVSYSTHRSKQSLGGWRYQSFHEISYKPRRIRTCCKKLLLSSVLVTVLPSAVQSKHHSAVSVGRGKLSWTVAAAMVSMRRRARR